MSMRPPPSPHVFPPPLQDVGTGETTEPIEEPVEGSLVARRVRRRLLVVDLVDNLVAVAVAGDCVERQGEGHRLSLHRHRLPWSCRRTRNWNSLVKARYSTP